RYGKLDWAALFEPAIRCATEGFVISEKLAGVIADEADKLRRYPASAALFLPGGEPLQPGQRLRNPALAAKLQRIAREGPSAFYRGEVARAIVNAVTSDGGVMTLGDLTAYKPSIRPPVRGEYRGYEILSAPPPSSGGTHVLQLLAIMEHFGARALGHNTPEYIHTLAEAMKWAFADRERYMADPDFVEVPFERLIEKDYARQIAARIEAGKAAEFVYPRRLEDPLNPGNTSHLCVVDGEGNVVSMTLTINFSFGSRMVVPECGFLLNDEMADFSFDEGSVNAVVGGKCPLSSMSPTIVLREGRPVMAVGRPGAIRIITAVVQVLMNVLDFGMSMDEAIEAPRFHCYSAGGKAATVRLESRIPPDTVEALKTWGHQVEVRRAYDPYFGGAQGIWIAEDGLLTGGADSRRDSACAGY
ncbi:MAG TPA: gamma-glutamyltransferase, partial [Firmicutes bacterium]|nr:gamma-glutamyltransferase [Bacillota bacterium]